MPDFILESILKLFKENFDRRQLELQGYWDYYDGFQAQFLPKFDGESDGARSKRIRNAVIENHMAPTVDISAARVYGSEDGEDPVSRRALDENANNFLHDKIYPNNDMPSLMIGNALQLNVTGTSVFNLDLFDTVTRKPLNMNEPPVFRRNKATIKYKLLDSRTTIPISRPNDESELGAIVRKYVHTNAAGDSLIDTLRESSDNNIESFEVVEYIDDNWWYKWARPLGSDDSQEWAAVDSDFNPVDETNESQFRNPYGDVRIPFVVFKNIGHPLDVEGTSDLKNILPLQNDLNESIIDDRNVFRLHSFPVPKFMNGAKPPNPFVLSYDTVLQFEEDGQDMQFAQWNGEISASMERKKTLREQISVISQVSDLSRGRTDRIGQVRSSPAIRVLFASDLQKMKQKIPYIVKAEKWLLEATLRMWEIAAGQQFDSYESEIVLPKDVIGFDKLLAAQTDQIRVQTGIESVMEILKIEHPEMTDEEIMEMIEDNEGMMDIVNRSPNQSTDPEAQAVAQGE